MPSPSNWSSHPTDYLAAAGLCLLTLLGSSACGSGDDMADKTYPFDASVAPDKASGEGGSTDNDGTSGRGGSNGDAYPRTSTACDPARSSEHLPARGSVMAGGDAMFTRDLYALFESNCGACHIEQNQGAWRVTRESFASKIQDSLDRMRSNDDDASDGETFMPPPASGGKKWDDRLKAENDPIVELAALLEAWESAGSPQDVFYPSQGTGPAKDRESSAYLMDPDVGVAMTNLGNCIPGVAMFGSEAEQGDALDEMFEKADELPENLEDTDLFTLDAEALAKKGVVAFAPAYTLWADDAKKLRAVRVPRGKTIVFNPDDQSFTIPANTRFYKTFLKRVIDLDGNESYRKMETRLTVSRPDKVKPDGSREFQALFGTYAWNEQETEAKLVRDPLRNGKPFRDRTVTYITDEQQAYHVISAAPEDLQKELETKNLTRTYAIPGSERCIQCHMGAPNGSFVLGFTPLQLHRQKKGTHGVIEHAARDELSQLQRLIDYGLISGMASPDDVKLLEDTQGSRKPRNYFEVQAQGYMMGNCAHCHNPVGFPSVTAPELRDTLNLYPDKNGGVFQFPLERYSTRILRGQSQQDLMPYITPSLFDLHESADIELATKRASVKGPDGNLTKSQYLHAPWRSLIYRNVDSPFSYVDDSAILPHMPRHTPGYDCRSRQLLGSWMVSIPSRPKALIGNVTAGGASGSNASTGGAGGASSPAKYFTKDAVEVEATANEYQPYLEVPPDDPEFELAASEALKRVGAFRRSPRYNDCPTSDVDTVDPSVRDDPAVDAPAAISVGSDPEIPWSYTLPVPSRPHWFVTDLTEASGEWEPRRSDWQDILVKKDESLMRVGDGEPQTVSLLDSIKVTGNVELRDYALTEIPFGTWVPKTQCKFPSSVRTVDSYLSEEHPLWLDGTLKDGKPAGDAPVYSISPGGQVFAAICRSCHGPQADSRSRLADTIADLTGGTTRVANLRGGLFGPFAAGGASALPGDNILRVFGAIATEQVTAEDWAARYMAWMALGGTQRSIPQAIIQLVSISSVMGERRSGTNNIESGSANMLETARFLCTEVLPGLISRGFDLSGAMITPRNDRKALSALVYKNGDAELWERLCTLQNPLPVRVLDVQPRPGVANEVEVALNNPSPSADIKYITEYNLFKREGYGNHPVGDHTGAVQPTLTDANRAPWCLRPQPGAETILASAWAAKHGAGSAPPVCPAEALVEDNRLTIEQVTAWKKRGAMNAGLVAFIYMQELAKGAIKPVPDYDRCEELTP